MNAGFHMEKGKSQAKVDEETADGNEIPYKTDFDSHVILSNLDTVGATVCPHNLLPYSINDIYEIKHYRQKSQVFYRTIIKTTNYVIDWLSGISSGYSGEGPHGFYDVLKEVVDEDIASIVFDGKYDKAVITIK